MNQNTRNALDTLAAFAWFENVGSPIDDNRVVQVYSWDEAIGHCAGRHWSDITWEAQARNYNTLMAIAQGHNWGMVAVELGPLTEAMVDNKIGPVVRRCGLPKAFSDSVRYDIFLFAMECEYNDVIPANFFTMLSYFYYIGHFPCGWDGDFSHGRLIVF